MESRHGCTVEYERYLPDSDDKPPKTIPGHVANYVMTIRDDPRFLPADRKEIPWRRTFDEETYIGWLLTNSPVRMLPEEDREIAMVLPSSFSTACPGVSSPISVSIWL